MMVLVIGGSGSGKSEFAEREACVLGGEYGGRKYYVAAMRVFDEEGQRKVERHRRMRMGKGFDTIEQFTDIFLAAERMGERPRTVLLECMSNLVANEMFDGAGDGWRTAGAVAGKVVRDMEMLLGRTDHLVVVSGNVFEDGIVYEEPVAEYIRAMGQVNQVLVSMADKVVEVAAGIPVVVKGER
jgi:adenosylcobinamide kinase/adenosylcobinamide-phosphate guanylyltransferase